MELIELNVTTRTKTGNGPARVLRREGKIPAILYGPGTTPIMLSIPAKDFQNALKASTASQPLFNLTVEGEGNTPHAVMIKEMQVSPLSRESLHVDFYKIDMDRKIRVSVPIAAIGKSVGVEQGGMLQIVRREIEVLCLPVEIPDIIEIDVTDMDVGDSFHVQDISLEGDVEIPSDINFTVLTILSPTKEEEVEEELEEGLEEGEEAGEAAESEEQD